MSERWYVRNPRCAVVGRGDSCLAVVPGAVPTVVDAVETAALSVLLARLARPTSASALEDMADRETLDALVAAGMLVAGDEAALAALEGELLGPATEPACDRLVVGVTGAVSAIGVAPWLSELARRFCRELDVVLTEAARTMVSENGLRYLGATVWTDMFAASAAVPVPHMHLADADLVLIMPASANTLSKLAVGACSDLLSLVVAATEAPVVLVPSMNPRMWSKPAIRRNVDQLRRDGHYVVEPGLGVTLSSGQTELAVGSRGLDTQSLGAALRAILAHHHASSSRTS